MELRVRQAATADVAGVAKVHVATWQAAYRSVLPDAYLDALTPERSQVGWKRVVAASSEGSRSTILVAAAKPGEVVGFVHSRSSRDDDADPLHVGEVVAIYVLPSAWSTGVGRQLMTAAEEWLRVNDFSEATLWVLRENQRARRFYEAAGWAADGGVKEDAIGDALVHEVRYRRSL
jgi:GNAT superfamily N-acetyltransferase